MSRGSNATKSLGLAGATALAVVFGGPSAVSAQTAPVRLPAVASRSVKQLERAAAQKDAKAQYELAQLLEMGSEVAKDLSRALVLYRAAGENGEPNGYFRLGMIYEDGLGVPEDSEKALGYFKTAAAKGVVEAQYNLGTMYVGAHGTKRSLVEGLAWLIVATSNGASGNGEEQVRKRLVNFPNTITAAEHRAREIQDELDGPPAPAPVEAPKADTPPAKVPAGP